MLSKIVKRSGTEVADENLEKASGGSFYVDGGFGLKKDYAYDDAGNEVYNSKLLKNARNKAKKIGNGQAIKATKDQMKFLRDNGYVDIGGTRWYSDGSSRPIISRLF